MSTGEPMVIIGTEASFACACVRVRERVRETVCISRRLPAADRQRSQLDRQGGQAGGPDGRRSSRCRNGPFRSRFCTRIPGIGPRIAIFEESGHAPYGWWGRHRSFESRPLSGVVSGLVRLAGHRNGLSDWQTIRASACRFRDGIGQWNPRNPAIKPHFRRIRA